MRKNILIFGYTNFSKDEVAYWNQLSVSLYSMGFDLYVFGNAKCEFETHFFCFTFTEKLDNVDTGFFNARKYYNDEDFMGQLTREKLWYGQSDKDRLSALKYQKRGLELLVDELNPSLLILGNGEHAIELILKEIVEANGIPFFYFERGCLPFSWHFDESGITAGSSIAKKGLNEIDLPLSDEIFLNYRKFYLHQKTSWWHQPVNNSSSIRNHYAIADDSRLILFVNQLDNDTSNFLYSPHFNTNIGAFEWLCKTIKALHLNCYILVKKHPYYEGDEAAFTNVMEGLNINGSWSTDFSIFDCLEQSDLVCAVNSTSVYEAMLYEKPVLQLGQSILSNKSSVYELHDACNPYIVTDWFEKKNFSEKISNFQRFMSYMIKEELSFFTDEIEEFKYSRALLLHLILKRNDQERHGNFPLRYVNHVAVNRPINYSTMTVGHLKNMLVAVGKAIFDRIKKNYKIK